MMAADRRRYRRVHPAHTFLIRTFAPTCPTQLRAINARLTNRGERVVVSFDLDDDASRHRAQRLVRSAAALREVAVGGKAIREIKAAVEGDLLIVTALLVRSS
jgi:hypothetical protein